MVLRIVCIFGESGSGKSTLVDGLVGRFPSLFNVVNSYTNRPMRFDGEGGHVFVSDDVMCDVLGGGDGEVVASTKFGDYFYCSTRGQFVEDKVNLYVVDLRGVRDVLEFQRGCGGEVDVCVVCVKRSDIRVDSARRSRDVGGFEFGGFDFVVVDNDFSVDFGVFVLAGLVFDYFS